ncbi:YdhK family protein [Planomicrobium sp. CPCC 101110]|uniref:YdhK family protein n=1 Tax=Planomicrobium sp. CPCC 101110 TaxID=2599619 RepID=UPI0011B76EAA|nr:YdhK family protein [Planomicrobium sp. CPCC 101110]TWT25989.1 DUF1541 domain-containing protein [Planomicrobium sp. CPCC 101110]
MLKNKWTWSFMSLLTALTLGACNTGSESSDHQMDTGSQEQQESAHTHMDHSGSGEVPEGLAEAEAPAFGVGDKAMISASHMEGMDGAEATIVGAYDTTVYAVTYTPSGGGETVKNHKWVIHEELENPGEAPLKAGDKATLAADHMEGMDGAEATIDSAEETTVYMLDFTPTNGGEKVTNHKWVTENELTAN